MTRQQRLWLKSFLLILQQDTSDLIFLSIGVR